MKKVLVLFDGEHFSQGTLEFAKQMNEAGNILLTGLFLPSVDYTDVLYYYSGGIAGPLYIPAVDTDTDTIRKNIARFKEYCTAHGIEHRVHDQVNGKILPVIAHESRYADLVLLDGKSYYEHMGELTQQDYLEDTVLQAECPVLVIPASYKMPANIVIAYDGSKESVFAFKQFSYLLPHLCNIPAMVVYAHASREIPGLPYMEELCARYFTDLTFFHLEADAKHYFSTWITNVGNPLVVAGSYASRGLFRKHFAEDLLKEHKLPVFVAHR